MFKPKKLIIALVVAVFIGAAGWNVYQFYSVPKPCYRPMIYYNNTLFWDEKVVDGGMDGLEYIGTVNSSVPNGEKPDSDFECNSNGFMNAKLYRDGNGTYYLRCENGNLLLLGTAGKGTDYTTLAGRGILIPPLIGAEFTGDP